MKTLLLIAAAMAALCYPLFAQQSPIIEYSVELLREVSTGPDPGQIAYSDSPFGIAGVYRMSAGEDGLMYVNDWVYNYVDIFSREAEFVRRIDYSKFPMGLMDLYKINASGEIVGFQKGELVKVSRNGVLVYKLPSSVVPTEIAETARYYFFDDYVVFYGSENLPMGISPSGGVQSKQEMKELLKEMRESGTIYGLDSISERLRKFLDSNRLMLIGDRLIAPFEMFREYSRILASATEIPKEKDEPAFDFSGAKYISLAGFDVHDNSYWYVALPNRGLYAAFSKTGRLIAQIADNLHASVDNISPFGDILKMDFDRIAKVYRFYRILNTWDPISDSKVAAYQQSLRSGASGALKGLSTKLGYLSAPSTLAEPTDKNAYHPVKLFDGDTKTMWIEDAKGPGIGESITIGFDAPITTDEIQFMPGAFWKEYWKQNYRVKSLEVKLDDKVFTASFKDEMTVQSLKLSSSVTFKTAVFTITAVYSTTKWEDTAISEISFYNQGAKVEVDYSKFKEFLKKAP